jgi:oxalate---CoA ligase
MSVYRLTDSDSTVVVLPLFHVHGLLAGLLSPLSAGGSVTLPTLGRFSASTFWADMRASNATWYTAVPTVHQILLDRHATKPEQDGLPELRFIRSCSASLAPAILERLESAFNAPVLEAYAMTEASHLMTSNPLPKDGPHKPGSVGKPVGQELAILNDKGVPQPAGVTGEVCIRGPNVTKGYQNNPAANEAAFLFGWFHTGDLGYLDEDGYLHLVGRIKELINRGGK